MKTLSKRFYKENRDKILDIFLFGSFIKQKEKYGDIDVSLITKVSKEESIELVKKFEGVLNNKKFHVVYNRIEDLFSKEEPIWVSLFHEGYSLIHDKRFCVSLNLSSKLLVTYSSSVLVYKDQIRFYYALKGRKGKEGIIKETNTEFIAKGVLLVDIEKEDELTSFFMNWKIPFKKKRVFMQVD